MAKRPEWFWHLLLRAETKATKIAAQASHGPSACGDATFIEVYAKTLPALFTQPLERLDEQTGLKSFLVFRNWIIIRKAHASR